MTRRGLGGPDSDGSAQAEIETTSAPQLSVVVPAFNEANRLAASTQRLEEAIAMGSIDPSVTEVIVVDDGSTDATARRARDLLGHLPHLRVLRLDENRGKGSAVRLGVTEAQGSRVAFVDADMAINPEQLPLMWSALDASEVAIGSRTGPGRHVDRGSVLRTVMGEAFNRFVNATTGLSFSDTQCGFKAFRTPTARLLFHLSVIDRFAFDVELLFLARRLGLQVSEVAVDWCQVHRSRIRPLADPVSMIVDVVKNRIRRNSAIAIPALVVVSSSRDSTERLARSAAGPRLPVLRWHHDSALILFALSEQAELERVKDYLYQRGSASSVRPSTISLSELERAAPLDLIGATEADLTGIPADTGVEGIPPLGQGPSTLPRA